ncbi:MAG: hypothetical protein HYX51_04015 [Chloroflexi bacterium]|nr:hypothetical protein [Chloroflexota bacterium]
MRRGTAGAALALVVVDDRDLLGCPAPVLRPLGQGILPPSALRMALDLGGTGLADIDEGLPGQVPGRDLGVGRHQLVDRHGG